VAAAQSQRLYSGVGIFNWYYPSSPPQILRRPGVDLERGGLMCVVCCAGIVSFWFWLPHYSTRIIERISELRVLGFVRTRAFIYLCAGAFQLPGARSRLVLV
jgi:hypothetical protein